MYKSTTLEFDEKYIRRHLKKHSVDSSVTEVRSLRGRPKIQIKKLQVWMFLLDTLRGLRCTFGGTSGEISLY